MAVDFGGVKMKNPINTASGTFGYGWQFSELMDVSQLGAITTKGCAAEPWPGNPAPRMAEVPGGMMNSVGLQNPGVAAFAEQSGPWLADLTAKGTQVICQVAGHSTEEYVRALSASMLVSCDNAHAQHPAHPELADSLHAPQMNGGIVVKEAANQHYCTDAFSRAAFTAVLDDAEIPHQAFANRSDKAGGSTLGNISNMQVSVHGVDVGCAQLSMHSCMETAGARDVDLAIEALTVFYDTNVRIDGADSIELG